MEYRHWFSIAVLIALIIGFAFDPTPHAQADGLTQTIYGTLCEWTCDQIAANLTICYCHWEEKSHAFAAPPGSTLDITIAYGTEYHAINPITPSFVFAEDANCRKVAHFVALDRRNYKTTWSCVVPSSGEVGLWMGGAAYGYVMTVTITPFEGQVAQEAGAGLQRINNHAAIPYIIYVPTAGRVAAENAQFIDIWRLDDNGVGQSLLYISKEALLSLPEFPAENMLIASSPDGLVNVYKLTTGEYQVNIGPLDESKVYTTIFDGIPPTHTTNSTWVVPPQ